MATVEESLTFEPLLEKDGLQVSKSPWGPDDEIGRLNWITPESRREVLERLDGAGMFDLCVDYFIGMPAFGAFGDPSYNHWLTHTPEGSLIDGLTGAGREMMEKQAYSSCSF